MAELYDSVRQRNSNYVPQFIGSNFDTLKAVGDTLDTRYKRNKELSDSLAIQIANDRYFDKDQHIGDKHYKDLSNTIHEVSSSDPNFENSSQVIGQAVKNYATDRARIAALDNHKRYEQYLDLKHKLGAKGVDFTERSNPDFFTHGTVSPGGNINRFEHNLQEKLDYNAPKEKLFNDIEPDLLPLLSQYNPATGQIEGGATETNKAKIKAYLGQAFNRYKQDSGSEYSQEKEVLRNQGVPERLLDSYIAKSIMDVGQEKVLDRTKLSGENASHAFLSGLFPNEGNTPSAGSSQGEITPNLFHNPIVDDPSTLYQENGKTYQLYDKSNNKPVTSQDAQEAIRKITGAGGKVNIDMVYNKVEAQPEQGAHEKQYTKITSNVGKIYKNFNDYKEAAALAKQNAGNITSTGSEISPQQAETYNKEINSNGSLTIFVDSQPITLSNFAKQLGTSPSNIKFKTNKLFHESAVKGLPGGYVEAKVEVSDNKVQEHPTTVKIPLNNQGQAVSRNIDNIYKTSLYQGKDNYSLEHPYIVKDINGEPLTSANGNNMAIWTTTFPKLVNQQVEGEYPYETIVHKGVIDKNGNITKKEDMTLPVYKEYMEKIMRGRIGGTLNSGQTFNASDINPKTHLPQEEE